MKKFLGFTLIEVLIALIIISIALAASIRVTNQSIRDTTHVQNTMIAHWVAMNIISEIQVGIIKLPIAGNIKKGKTSMLNKKWDWVVENNKSLRITDATKIKVTVSYRHRVVTSVTGYVPQ